MSARVDPIGLEIAAAFDRRALHGYIDVCSGPGSGPEWAPLPLLSSAMDEWLSRVAVRTGGDGPATIAFLAGWSARALGGLPAALAAHRDRAVVAEPDDLWLRRAPGGWVDGIAICGASLFVTPHDPLAGASRTIVCTDASTRWRAAGLTIAALGSVIVADLAVRGLLTPRALFSFFADAAAAAAVAGDAKPHEIRTLLRALSAGSGCSLRSPLGRGPSLRRTSCCLAFRTPAGSRCADCPLQRKRDRVGR